MKPATTLLIRSLHYLPHRVAFLFSLVLFSEYYVFSFNFSIGINMQYFMLLVLSAFFIVSLTELLFLRCKISIASLFLAFMVITCEWLLLVIKTPTYNLSNEYFTVTTGMAILAFLILNSAERTVRLYLPAALCFVYCIELYQAYYQWKTHIHSKNLSLSITGTLDNSGIFSCYLVTGLPLVFYSIASLIQNVHINRILNCVLSILVVIILYLTESRTAWFSFLLVALLSCIEIGSSKTYKWVVSLMSGIIFLCMLVYSSKIKTASAEGRALIWKVSLLHFSEAPLTGTGLGTFPSKYPNWQINYFTTHKNVLESEFINADETYNAFNEPLQWLLETGMVGIFVIGVLLYLALKKVGTQDADSSFILSLKHTVCLILATSLTTYSLHCNLIFFLFVYSVFSILKFKKTYNIHVGKFWGLILLFPVYCLVLLSKEYSTVRLWNQFRISSRSAKINVEDTYGRIYKELAYNGKFLFDYSLHVSDTAKDIKEQLLRDDNMRYVSMNYFQTLANFYLYHKDTLQAIDSYKKMTHYIPSRYLPNVELMRLYYSIKDTENTIEECKKIIEMPIKKFDPQIGTFKVYSKEILRQLNP